MTEPHFHTQSSLLSALDDLGLKTTTLEHEAVFRVDQGLDIKSSLLGAHTKNLFVRDDKGKMFLISAEQSTKINLKTLPKTIGCGRLSFGSEERLFAHLGVRPGSVTAFALINDPLQKVSFILDKALDQADLINFHPLVNTATTQISRKGLERFLTHYQRNLLIVDFKALE